MFDSLAQAVDALDKAQAVHLQGVLYLFIERLKRADAATTAQLIDAFLLGFSCQAAGLKDVHRVLNRVRAQM
jgi:hypothetical protein